MTVAATSMGAAKFDRLVAARTLAGAVSATLEFVLDGGARAALVGVVDSLGERHTAQSDGFPRRPTRQLPQLAAALADADSGEVARGLSPLLDDGIEGAALEMAEGLFAVVLTEAEPTADPRRLSEIRATALLALARAGLSERDRRRSEELARLQATAKDVAASLDLDEVLTRIVNDAAALVGARSGEMLLLDEVEQKLRVVAVSNLSGDLIGFELDFGEGLSSQAILAGKPLYVADYAAYEHRIDRLIGRYDWGSMACAPLVIRGTALGALNVHFTRPSRGFRSGTLGLLAAFADHAAIAIDHARRYENEVVLAGELAAANEELSRSLRLQTRLAEQVVLDRGLHGIAEELARLLERPVVVQDHLWRVVAGAAPDAGDGWTSLAVPRPDERRREPPERAGSSAAGSGAPGITTPGRAPALGDRFVLPVRLGREAVGHLVLPADQQLAPVGRALAEIAVSGVALEFAKLRAASEVEQRLRGEAVLELLTGTFETSDAIAARCARLGYDLSEPRTALVFRPDDRVAARHETIGGAEVDRAVEALREELARRAPGSIVASHGDSIVALVTSVTDPAVGNRLARRLQELIAARMGATSVSVAIGDTCMQPQDYRAGFELARETLALMSKLGRRGAVVGARELGAYRLILKSSNRAELDDFAMTMLGPLLEHDRRHRTDLLATLRAYLEEGQVQRRAAGRLVVHVNTIVYRLKRIEELLDVDLGDPARAFDLMLALRVVDLMNEG